jgi:hypothetical protein
MFGDAAALIIVSDAVAFKDEHSCNNSRLMAPVRIRRGREAVASVTKTNNS